MVKKKPVFSDVVVEHIRKSVRNETLLPGQKICEQTVASELNVSRAPVREALNRLSGIGLLVSDPRHGKRVNALSTQQVQDAYILGGAVCGVSVSHCLDQYTSQDIYQLECITDSIRNIAVYGGSEDDLERLGQEFNAKLMSYPNLRWYHTPVDFCALISCFLYYRTRRKVITPREDYISRKYIMKAIKAKNPEATEKVLREVHFELGKRMKVAGYDNDSNHKKVTFNKWFSEERQSKRTFFPSY